MEEEVVKEVEVGVEVENPISDNIKRPTKKTERRSTASGEQVTQRRRQ